MNTETVEPLVLVVDGDPERKPRLYVCPKCGGAHSPAIYLAKPEDAHRAARDAAANCYSCRTHNVCSECGEQCDKHWTKCSACRRKADIERAEKADPSSIGACFGLDSQEFHHSPVDAADAGEEWVFAATFRPFKLEPNWIVDQIIDDHHEDASPDDLIGLDALIKAIATFNDAQMSGSYDIDWKRIANVSALRKDQP